jgi:hypothetical protein
MRRCRGTRANYQRLSFSYVFLLRKLCVLGTSPMTLALVVSEFHPSISKDAL